MEFRENGESIAWTRWIIYVKHFLFWYSRTKFVDYKFMSRFDLFALQVQDSTDGVVFIQMAPAGLIFSYSNLLTQVSPSAIRLHLSGICSTWY